MPICVYCHISTSAAEPAAHVFPEGLVANDLVLQTGDVCGKCNRYFGHELDAALLDYPWIAFCIQMLGLPGKAGRKRERLGRVERHTDRSVSIEIEQPRETNSGRRKHFDVSIGPDKHFSIYRFRRALHHIGFNILTLQRGSRHALKPHFDETRAYIRAPRHRQSWPFVQVAEDLISIRPVVQGRMVPEAPGETVCIRIVNLDCYVDLLNRGGLGYWSQHTFNDVDVFVHESWKPPRRDKTGGKHRFWMRIQPE